MQIFMRQSSVFKRNKLAFFVISQMKLKRYVIVPFVLFVLACGTNSQDPAKNAPVFSLKVERFDSAFFSMDTVRTKQSIANLIKQYPNFAPEFFAKILMLKNVEDTHLIKAYYKTYLPIYKETKTVNALKVALPQLQEAFKRIHFYFPKYALTHNLVFFVGPFESYGNIVTEHALAIGLQMHLGVSSKWYQDEHIQTIYPNYLSRRYTPDYITVSSVQNILNDIDPQIASEQYPTLMAQMIQAGKQQYVINACMPNTPDSIRMGFTNAQFINFKKQESNIWQYILHEKLSYSTNPNDIDAFMQDGVFSSLFGDDIPSNAGKYIGYKIVDTWMHQSAQKNISMEDLLSTPADKIFTAAGYAP